VQELDKGYCQGECRHTCRPLELDGSAVRSVVRGEWRRRASAALLGRPFLCVPESAQEGSELWRAPHSSRGQDTQRVQHTE